MGELSTKDKLIKIVVKALIENEIDMSDAEKLLGLSKRQIYRKKALYIKFGDSSIIRKKRKAVQR